MSRRDFMKTTGVATTVAAAASQGIRMSSAQAATGELGAESRDLGAAALEAAKAAGATFADVRVILRRDRSLGAREDRVRYINESASLGFNVRALVNGAWGFAASHVLTLDEAARVARQAVAIAHANAKVVAEKVELAPEPSYQDHWQTPIHKDPFRIPIQPMVEQLLNANARALKAQPKVKFASSSLHFVHEAKLFMSSEGSHIEQDHYRLNPGFSASAVVDGDFYTRNADFAPVTGGYEYVEELDWSERADYIAEEAVAYLGAKSVEPGEMDLVLAPSNLWLTIHESVGHPTELDRALGYEANYAGTSFATVDKWKSGLQYASEIVNLVADRTIDRGLATVGYDDEGVKSQQWHIVKDGKFVAYQTTREQAAWVNEKRSRGCSYTQGWQDLPFQRIPNLHLAPGKKDDVDLDDLVSGVDHGVLVEGRGSWSIDHQRYNFQFGGGSFREIKNGKVAGRLRDVAYQSNTLDFWHSCDGVGGKKGWEINGTFYDGKGEPSQVNACSHGCPPARFRKVNVLNTGSNKA